MKSHDQAYSADPAEHNLIQDVISARAESITKTGASDDYADPRLAISEEEKAKRIDRLLTELMRD